MVSKKLCIKPDLSLDFVEGDTKECMQVLEVEEEGNKLRLLDKEGKVRAREYIMMVVRYGSEQ